MKSKPLTGKDAERLAALMNRAIEHGQLMIGRGTANPETGVIESIGRGEEAWEAASITGGGLGEVELLIDDESIRALSELDSERHAEFHRKNALLSACADMLVCIRDNPEFHAEQRKAARALMDYGVVRVCNRDLTQDAEAEL